jgi:hypothetical protein
MATMWVLRATGLDRVAGIAVRPQGRPRCTAAQLAALQRAGPGRPFGFLLGSSALGAAAEVWQARPERVSTAHHELRSADQLLDSAARRDRRPYGSADKPGERTSCRHWADTLRVPSSSTRAGRRSASRRNHDDGLRGS